MAKYTPQDIIRMVRENDIRFLRLQFTDIFGAMKSVTVTASQVEKALKNDCRFDGSSIEGFTRIEPKGSTADNKVGSILKYQGKDAAKK